MTDMTAPPSPGVVEAAQGLIEVAETSRGWPAGTTLYEVDGDTLDRLRRAVASHDGLLLTGNKKHDKAWDAGYEQGARDEADSWRRLATEVWRLDRAKLVEVLVLQHFQDPSAHGFEDCTDAILALRPTPSEPEANAAEYDGAKEDRNAE